MKTSELTGTLLDYWVAKAEGLEPWAGATMPKGEFMWEVPHSTAPRVGWLSHKFSRDWSLSGPIIERERIAVWSGGAAQWHAILPGANGGAYPGDEDYIDANSDNASPGPTPLIAAMRAYVAAKLGDELPDQKDIRNS